MNEIKRYTITKATSGHYAGEFYPTFYFEDESIRPKRVFSLHGSKKKVEAKAEIYMKENNERVKLLNASMGKLTDEKHQSKKISDLLDQYIKYSTEELKLRESTMIEKKGVIENVIKPFYGDKVLGELTEELMHEYLRYCNNQKSRKGMNGKIEGQQLSSRRIQKFWEHNKAFISWLKNQRYINSDPAANVKRPKSENMTVAQYWKKEEFKSFLEVIPVDSQDRALFLLAFLTGMRQGEILGLTWADINFKDNEIIIDKQYNTKTQKVDRTKTKDSIRKTKFPEVVKKELLSLKNRFEDYYGMNESRMKSLPVFTNGALEHYSGKTLSNHFRTYILDANVKKIKFHELRNSFITNAIDSGIPVDVVAGMVGHKDVMTTLNVYKCTTDRHTELALETINDFSSDIL